MSGLERLLADNAARALPGRAWRPRERVVIETTGQMRTVCGALPSVEAGRARLAAVVAVAGAGDFLPHCHSGDQLRQRPDRCGEEEKEGKSV